MLGLAKLGLRFGFRLDVGYFWVRTSEGRANESDRAADVLVDKCL